MRCECLTVKILVLQRENTRNSEELNCDLITNDASAPAIEKGKQITYGQYLASHGQ